MAGDRNGTNTGVWRGMVAEKLDNIEKAVDCLPELCDRMVKAETQLKIHWWALSIIVGGMIGFALKVFAG